MPGATVCAGHNPFKGPIVDTTTGITIRPGVATAIVTTNPSDASKTLGKLCRIRGIGCHNRGSNATVIPVVVSTIGPLNGLCPRIAVAEAK